VQQRGEERPVGRREPDPLPVQLALKYCDLVAQRQDLDDLPRSLSCWPVQRVRARDGRARTALVYELGHGQLHASLAHSRSTCPGTTHPWALQRAAGAAKIGSPGAG
jgi:hypothetical protein